MKGISMRPRSSNSLVCVVALAAIIVGAIPAHASTFDTTTAWDGGTVGQIGNLGRPGPPDYVTSTFGQTFIAPTTDNVLQDFTFYFEQVAGSNGSLSLQADVYAWTGALQGASGSQNATGAPLFSSEVSFTDNGSFQAVTVNTGGLTLTPGGDYVLLFTTSDPTSLSLNSSGNTQLVMGDIVDPVTGNYLHVANDGGGGMVFTNASTSSQLTANWDSSNIPDNGFPDFGDAAFKADFNSGTSAATPEPSSLVLLGTGLVGLGGLVRRRMVA